MTVNTRCPDCGQVLSLTNEELRQYWPTITCPRCGGRFDPLAGLVETPRLENLEAPLPTGLVPAEEPPVEEHPAPEVLKKPRPLPQPSVSEKKREEPRPPALAWILASLTLSIGLLGQLAWWERGKLIQSTTVRPLLEQACAQLGCRVPLPRLPRELVILDRSLELRPAPPDGLQLRIELLNQAQTAQPFPTVQLELYDAREGMTAVGRFPPETYRHGESPAFLESQDQGTVALDLAAPVDEPSGFRIRLM